MKYQDLGQARILNPQRLAGPIKPARAQVQPVASKSKPQNWQSLDQVMERYLGRLKTDCVTSRS